MIARSVRNAKVQGLEFAFTGDDSHQTSVTVHTASIKNSLIHRRRSSGENLMLTFLQMFQSIRWTTK